MKMCTHCGASNPENAKFCNECARELAIRVAPKAAPTKVTKDFTFDASELAASITRKKAELHASRKADILFVLDCTGSMQGEIDAIKDSIASFADTIKSDGVRARVGLIEFRDRLIGEEARVLVFGGQVFTDNPDLFREELAELEAAGGGDDPESSLDALMLALHQPFSPDANKVIVLITDAPPHIPDKETPNIETVIRTIQSISISQLYIVMRTEDTVSQIYLRLLERTRGLVFDLGQGDDFRTRAEHFKRTLMSLGKTISAATI